MNQQTTYAPRPPQQRSPASAGGGPAADTQMVEAQAALDRARAIRERVDRVLGGLDIQDARNSGGQ